MHLEEPIINLFQFLNQQFSELDIDRRSQTSIICARYRHRVCQQGVIQANCSDFSLINYNQLPGLEKEDTFFNAL
jgi:hypothetical protein